MALVRSDAAARAVTWPGAAPVRGALADLHVLRAPARARHWTSGAATVCWYAGRPRGSTP